MTLADLLPWLNLLLPPAVALLVSINARLARLEVTQSHHAQQLQALGTVAPDLAGLRAVQQEQGRRLDAVAARP